MARKKKTKVKVGIKEPGNEVKKIGEAKGKPPKAIKMTMSLSGPAGVFQKGKSYDVPRQCPTDTARSWVQSGAALDVSEK